MFRSFKRYLPSGLYGRVALILVLPVVLLWLVVSIVFIQRHFEGVTEQMSRAVISELSLLSKRLIADQGLTGTTENLAKALNITIETVAADAPDQRLREGGVGERELALLYAHPLQLRVLGDRVEAREGGVLGICWGAFWALM